MSTEGTTAPSNYGDYQMRIYAEAMLAGETPAITTDLAGLEQHAAAVLDPEALGYIVPSAGSGATARANREAFDRWRIEPRMLSGATQREHSCTVLGTTLPAPLLLAPVGVQTLAHPDGELASARAAATFGVPFVHSTMAAHSFEQVAHAGGDGPRWYQLYPVGDRHVMLSFLDRAKAAGFSALVVTLDATLLGWRPADLDRGYLPFFQNVGTANFLTDPVFLSGLDKPVEEDPKAAVTHFARVFPNPGIGWSDLALLRDRWDGPLVLKGICSVPDARLAVEHGIDGIVVSNHGGRQVDGATASLDALPAIADAVGDQLTVLFDSGIRSAPDVVKALALGAQAVLIGRPYLYGLALDGQAGVEHVLRCMLAELDLTLTLSGYASHHELTRESLKPRP
jgi:lactate 2-monooxygenase